MCDLENLYAKTLMFDLLKNIIHATLYLAMLPICQKSFHSSKIRSISFFLVAILYVLYIYAS